MNQKLCEALINNFELIKERWADSIKKSIPAYDSVSLSELKTTTGIHLDGIIDFLRTGNDSKLRQSLEDIAYRRAGVDFRLSQTQMAFFQGEKILMELLQKEFENEPHELNPAAIMIESCFKQGFLYYSTAFCQRCSIEVERHARTIAVLEAEAKRLEEERFFIAAINDSADAIIFLDANNIIRGWNKGAEMIFGYKAEEMVDSHINRLLPPELKALGELEKLYENLKAEGYVQHYQTERLTKSGNRIAVDLTRTLIKNSNGKVIGSTAVIRDITEQKRIAREMIQTERLAIIGRMASQLAHEVRNPLSAISLNAEILTDEIDGYKLNSHSKTEEAKQSILSIQAEVERLEKVVEEYLQFSRLPRLELQTVQINEIIIGLIDFLASSMQAKGIKITKHLDQNLPKLEGDVDQLRRAFLNLLKNATEAMPDGGRVCVVTKSELGQVKVLISDTGIGIREEDLERIFMPFYSTKESGTGLGLPLTQQIIKEHRGEISCQSEIGKGTSFIISFPINSRFERQ